MTVLGNPVLPAVELGQVPFWRQWLRGFSQCAFQANEVTGLLFVLAVLAFSPTMAAFYVVSVLLATVTARLLKADRTLLDLGLMGFNSGLMGLALGNFYELNLALWGAVAFFAVVVAAVAVGMSKWLPIPFLAAPFIVTFWVLWLIAESTNLIKLEFAPFGDAPVQWVGATVVALGATLFTPLVVSGALFLLGVLVSEWRHAVVAVIGAVVAVGLATQAGVPGESVNAGFVGFNAVLAAIAAYVVLAADLRLSLLAAMLATWFFSYLNRNAPVPALASGFVLSIWFLILVGWVNDRFFGAAATKDEPATASA